MLELLAGPFPLTFDGEETSFDAAPAWHDAIGLIGNIRAGDDDNLFGCIAQIDGAAYSRNAHGIQGECTQNLATGAMAVYDSQGSNTRFYREMEMHTLRGVPPFVDDSVYGNRWTVLPDRELRAYNAQIYTLVDGVITFEAQLGDLSGANSGTGWLSPSRTTGRVFACFPGGQVFEYDYQNKTVVGLPRWIPACYALHYSPALGVFVAVHRLTGPLDEVRIYADEVHPTQVTDPVALEDMKPGRVVVLEASVLGDQDEPCPGMVVSWSSSAGEILDERTATDAAGTARTRLRIAPDEVATEADVAAEVLA